MDEDHNYTDAEKLALVAKIEGCYSILYKEVKEVAKLTLLDLLGKESELMVNSAHTDGFCIEAGEVVVVFNYEEPYSGWNEICLPMNKLKLEGL